MDISQNTNSTHDISDNISDKSDIESYHKAAVSIMQ